MTFVWFMLGWAGLGIAWLAIIILLDKFAEWPRQVGENTLLTAFGLVSVIVSFWPLLIVLLPQLKERFL